MIEIISLRFYPFATQQNLGLVRMIGKIEVEKLISLRKRYESTKR